MIQTATPYPATLSIDYPEKARDRVSVAFRLLLMIPIAIIVSILRGSTLFIAALLMILFRQKYPRWWFDWNLNLTRFNTRVMSFVALLRDEYPSTDEEQSVHLDLVYPDAKQDLGQGMPLVKWFLAIPHYFILVFLGLAAVVCAIISWFAILFTGKMPRSLFDFILGVMRWALRVSAYAFLLITDKYPPFSLEP
ncbi:hypothetical protein Dform_00626 [Dehalogenimonas formicexedens]|uniref:DUF4389 domain-containing protein n=1 Tax=Dehalogenimonas formicexedens TaxID=1839801 RepID=A0A1P8F677_9CHLR|nr:DUF4389 domain-containing protein [Dehalogenimonas formicexedens]APV43981.1 hypothetical protein Dform_00626 [Dehalogenimonas formicexedens]